MWSKWQQGCLVFQVSHHRWKTWQNTAVAIKWQELSQEMCKTAAKLDNNVTKTPSSHTLIALFPCFYFSEIILLAEKHKTQQNNSMTKAVSACFCFDRGIMPIKVRKILLASQCGGHTFHTIEMEWWLDLQE